jgi:hypothetical protein
MTVTGDTENTALIRSELERGLHEFQLMTLDVEFQIDDGERHAVAWSFTAQPKPHSTFLGVHLTEPLTVRGVTLIQPGPSGVLLRWYIDWLDALNRAGLNAALRPVPDGPQPEVSDLQQLLRS